MHCTQLCCRALEIRLGLILIDLTLIHFIQLYHWLNHVVAITAVLLMLSECFPKENTTTPCSQEVQEEQVCYSTVDGDFPPGTSVPPKPLLGYLCQPSTSDLICFPFHFGHTFESLIKTDSPVLSSALRNGAFEVEKRPNPSVPSA